jgi:hypothetical protein
MEEKLMYEFESNSHRSKEEKQHSAPEKRVEKVVSGKAKPKKKNDIQRFADVFVSEDVQNVKSYIMMDILVPAVKKAISDIVTKGIDMILYGEQGHPKGGTVISETFYRNCYDDKNGHKDNHGNKNRNGYNYDDVILDNRGEAEEVMMRMDELINIYGMASVADLYDLVGFTGRYTDNKYGWTDIRSAKVIRTRDGYLLKFPRALPLD